MIEVYFAPKEVGGEAYFAPRVAPLLFLEPIGTITSQPPPDGQRQRFVGTAANATSGSYSLIGSGGAATIGPASFVITDSAFDFTVADIPPGEYTPQLTVTGPGGVTAVTGTSALTILGISGEPAPSSADAPVVTGVTVTPATATGSRTFSATVSGNNSPSQEVTWAASAGSITSDGAFTAPAGTSSVQVITITATSVQDPSKSGTATVTIAAIVVPPGSTVTGVVVTPATATGSRVFDADVVGTNSPSQAVTWAASAGSITSGGVFTAPAATSAVQVITITATSAQDPSKSGTATVTIAAVVPPVVLGVRVTPLKPYLAGGASLDFDAQVFGVRNPPQTVTWTTTFGTISSDGVLTAPTTSVPRKAIVTATSTADNTKSASTSVTITPPVLFGVAGPRSKARTFVVTDPQVAQDTSGGVGTFWNMANPAKPKGVKDPNAVIDVSFDWGPWFQEAGDNYASHEILVDNGLVLMATNHEAKVISAFIAAGDVGALTAVTCRIKTTSTPPREDDRTVYLRIKER